MPPIRTSIFWKIQRPHPFPIFCHIQILVVFIYSLIYHLFFQLIEINELFIQIILWFCLQSLEKDFATPSVVRKRISRLSQCMQAINSEYIKVHLRLRPFSDDEMKAKEDQVKESIRKWKLKLKNEYVWIEVQKNKLEKEITENLGSTFECLLFLTFLVIFFFLRAVWRFQLTIMSSLSSHLKIPTCIKLTAEELVIPFIITRSARYSTKQPSKDNCIHWIYENLKEYFAL